MLSFGLSEAGEYPREKHPSRETYPEMKKIKESLNNVKSKLDDIYSSPKSTQNFETITLKLDLYRKLKYVLTEQYNAEGSTNAFLKLYEMLEANKEIFEGKKEIVSFHICELPGGFVFALNHFIKTKFPKTKLTWFAESIITTGKGYFGDTYGLMKKYTPGDSSPGQLKSGYVIFGNGDITIKENIEQYIKNFGKKVDFVTSDCGISVVGDYNNQEMLMNKIIIGQMLCSLGVLKKGGSYIMKLFTFYEPVTISLIVMIRSFFESVEIVKPETSRPVNSEAYLVCKGFKGNFVPDYEMLKESHGFYEEKKLRKSKIYKEIVDAAKHLSEAQIKTLERYISVYEKYKDDPYKLNMGKEKISKVNEWISKNRIEFLENKMKLL